MTSSLLDAITSGSSCDTKALSELEWRVATSEWRRVEWSGAERTGVESGQIGVEESGVEWRALKELEWRVASSELRRVEWSGAERTGVESGQIGVKEGGMR